MKLKFAEFLLIFALFLVPGTALAQGSTPSFAELTVELWPEFDQPEVLVIYRARLSSDTPLPAVVTLNFPPHISSMHAIAVERNGGLFSVEDSAVVTNKTASAFEITLSVEQPNFQLEYYDPQLLVKNGEQRQIEYTFQADYAVGTTRIQVQQPLEASNFAIFPEASGSFSDQNGLHYDVIEAAGLAAGDSLQVSASYNRSTDQPSAELFPASGGDIQVLTGATPATRQPPWGYVLIGLGVLLLAATGGYWWWSNRAAAEPPSLPRTPSPRPVPPPARPSPPRPSPTRAGKSGGYCHQCGSALREDSNFCHVCGTPRRQP